MKKALIPYLKHHYPSGGYVFWPDLAATHYARDTLDLLDTAHVPVVTREENPPNVPLLRPIEDFWGLVKQEVYNGGCEARSDAHLKSRIRSVLRLIDPEVPSKMMGRVPQLVRAADRLGVSSAFH